MSEIKIRFGGDSRTKLQTRGIMPPHEDGAEWTAHALATLDRQKTNVVIKSEEEASALLRAVGRMRDRVPGGGSGGGEDTTWLTHAHVRAFDRVHEEIVEACKEREWCGYEPAAEEITVECDCGKEFVCKADAGQVPCKECGWVEV